MFTLRLLGSASLEGPDGPIAGRAALRQRIALLALLAVEHPRPLSRDKLVAYLWPESGTGDARHLLRESLYILRSALGEDSVLSTGDDLRLNPDRLTCDLWEFEAALAGTTPRLRSALHHGPFLSGFHLSDTDEFERWADGERSRLARRYAQALEQLAEREMRDDDPVRAAEWWSRLAAEDRYNSRIALRYMQALEAAGDRAGALRHAGIHSELLRSRPGAAPERRGCYPGGTAQARIAGCFRWRADAAPTGRRLFLLPLEPPARRPPSPLVAPEPRRPRPPPVAGVTRRVAPGPVQVAMGLGVLAEHSRGPPLLQACPHRVAAAPFENRTGRPDLDDLGPMAADWIIRGVMETPLVDVTDLEAVYARTTGHAGSVADPLTLAQHGGAGLWSGVATTSPATAWCFRLRSSTSPAAGFSGPSTPSVHRSRGPPPPSRCCESASRPVSARWSMR